MLLEETAQVGLVRKAQPVGDLLHHSLVARGYLRDNPERYVLGRRIERQHAVQVLMIEKVHYLVFHFGEVNHHSVGVEFTRFAHHLYLPVVAMCGRTLALIRKRKMMTGRYFECLFYVTLIPQHYSLTLFISA